MLLKSIAQLPISQSLSLALMRLFRFATSKSSSAPLNSFETASINFSKASSPQSFDQNSTISPTSSKKKLSHQAQSAIWAERVIHFILNAKQLTNIHSHSLREQILQLQNPDSLHQFEAEPKEKVMQLFTSGVPLNGLVFNQNRVTSARQTFQHSENRNFVFCPNLLVTKQIFNIMMEFQSNFLVTGGFGISKTVSIILFIQLSNHVNSFLYKAAQPQHKDTMKELLTLRNVQVNPFFFDQGTQDKRLEHPKLELSGQTKYFSTTIPRYWYWNIRSEYQHIQSLLRQTLLCQAPQISYQRKNKLRSITDFQEFIRQLKQCYPPFQSYCMKLVVDQFKEIVSRASYWNQMVDKYKSMPQENDNDSGLDNYKQYKLCAQEHFILLKAATNLSNLPVPSFVLNSLMSIQKDILEGGEHKQPEKVYFDIKNIHGDFKIKEIHYLQGLNGSFIEFLHKFWFEIERKLKIRDNDNTAIEEMKKLFLEEVKDKRVNYSSRFLFLREYLTQKKIQQIQKNYNQFKEKSKQQNPFKGIYESFTQEYTKKYQQQLRRYFQTEKTDRSLSLFYALYDMAAIQSYTADKDKELTVKLKDLAHRTKLNALEQLNLDKYKEILPFTFTQDKQSVIFYWKPKQFTSTVHDILFAIQGNQVFYKYHQIGAFRQSPTLRDYEWKNKIIQSLKKGADVTFRQPKLQQLYELRFNIEKNRFTTFQHFNQYVITPKSQVKLDKRLNKENRLKKQQAIAYIKKVLQHNPKCEKYPEPIETYRVHKVATASISKNLKDLFAKCDQHPGEYCFANVRKRSEYEFINFIIAKKQLDKYRIFTFDASILRKKTRFQDAKALFTDLLSRQTGKPNYMINHVALCHSDVEQQIPYDANKIFNIFYSPWEEITFRSTSDTLALKSFYRMRTINNFCNEDLMETEQLKG